MLAFRKMELDGRGGGGGGRDSYEVIGVTIWKF